MKRKHSHHIKYFVMPNHVTFQDLFQNGLIDPPTFMVMKKCVRPQCEFRQYAKLRVTSWHQ